MSDNQKENSPPPRETWPKLGINELYTVKSQLFDLYYAARAAGASYADQYLKFTSFVDSLIQQKTAEQEQQNAQ